MTKPVTHSPGPWRVYQPNGRSPTFKVRDVNDFLIIELFNGANARLITMAPEMLSLLETVLLESVAGTALNQQTAERIRTTILKATGRA